MINLNFSTSFFWLSSDKLLRLVIGIVILFEMTRFLGIDKIGALYTILAVLFILHTVVSFGMQNICTKKAVENRDENDGIATAVLISSLVISLFVMMIAVPLLKYYNTLFGIDLSIIFYLFVILIRPLENLKFVLEAQRKHYVYVKIEMVFCIVGFLTKVLAIRMNMPLEIILYIYFVEMSIPSVIIASKVLRNNNIKFDFGFQNILQLLSESAPLALSSILIILYMKSDLLMLGYFSTEDQVSLYAINLRIVEILVSMLVAFAISIYPDVIDGSISVIRKIIKLYVITLFCVVTLLQIIIFFLGNYVITKTLGVEFSYIANLLHVSLLSVLIIGLGVIRHRILLKSNLQKIDLYGDILGVATNIGLNYFFIPLFGAMGAAVATLLSYIIVNIYYIIFFEQIRKLYRRYL